MLKPHSNPYGYKKLLVYIKAGELQTECRRLSSLFPKTKTLIDLADQMDRSARSVKQNIVEGWKRNTTKEYGTFLGFSIGANAELEEDCDDIWKGVYPELMGRKGIMGERGEKGTPSTPSTPLAPSTPSSHSSPFSHLDIEKLKFYPLDPTLPPIVQLKLRCKEINMLLTKLQNSLEMKMKKERTMSLTDRVQMKARRVEKDEEWLRTALEEGGFERLENGRVVRKKEERE